MAPAASDRGSALANPQLAPRSTNRSDENLLHLFTSYEVQERLRRRKQSDIVDIPDFTQFRVIYVVFRSIKGPKGVGISWSIG